MFVIAMALLLAAPPAPPAPTPPAAAPERKICRSYAEIGSLVRKQRMCHTAAEWRVVDGEQETANQRMLEGRRLQTITR